MIKTSAKTIALILAGTLPSAAQDVIVYGGGELEYLFAPGGSGSADTATLSAYVEAEVNGAYLGFSGEVANDSVANELTAYVGYRRDLDSGFSYDLSYSQYYYPNDGGACCGEILLS
ncbi:MAG: hypothetical protein V4516_16265, partial [Pseudomonadota bacterium]